MKLLDKLNLRDLTVVIETQGLKPKFFSYEGLNRKELIRILGDLCVKNDLPHTKVTYQDKLSNKSLLLMIGAGSGIVLLLGIALKLLNL